jgi:SAM-dependent methyltransferase
MVAFFAPGGAGEILPRILFLEPLLAGRRVLEVGAAGATDGASALLLAERGAASVLSLDEAGGAERAARLVTHPAVQFRNADPAQLPPGAFDVVVAHDGMALAHDPARLEALRALLSPAGVLLTAIPAPYGAALTTLAGAPPPSEVDLPPYEHVAAALARVFPVVEAATQSPSVGYAVAAGEAGEDLPFRVDGSLAGPAEAAFYLFLCAYAPSGLRGVSLVALPSRDLWDGAQAAQRERAQAEQRASEDAAEARAELARTQAERTEAAEVARVLAAEAGATRAEGQAARAALQEELDLAGRALATAYGELARAGERAAAAETRSPVAGHGPLDAGDRREAGSGAPVGAVKGSLEEDERRLAGEEQVRSDLDRADRALARAYEELHRAGDAAAERLADAGRAAGEAWDAHLAELARLRDECARRGAELVEARRTADARAEQVAALAAEVEELTRSAAPPSAPPLADPALPVLQARVRELEEALAAAAQAHGEAVAAPARSVAPGDPPGALEKVVRERDAYAQHLAEREARIARMQREIADKTERLARLAQELSAAKSRGALGRLFQR